MKHHGCSMVTLSLLIFFSLEFTYAQTQPATRDVIIQVPGIDLQRGFPEIKNRVATIEGVHVTAFCQSQSLIFLRIDSKKLADNKPVYTAIQNLGFQFYLKPDVTFSKAMLECRDRKQTIYEDLAPRSE